MASGRRRTAVPEDGAAGEEKGPVEEKPPIASGERVSLESEVATLRRRWELASVLNFFSVFKPVIGSDLKWVPAEKIEMALIQPNSLLVQIHITLLKGIPPASKILDGPESEDAWVTVLCNKLEPWWQWVAEGEFPLNAANGEEISGYKELSPTNRLLILKALCELRVEQYDAAYHVNDSLKDGAKISSFRIDEIGCNGNHTSYWFDANAVTGYRLYKEVKTNSKTKLKGKLLTAPTTRFQWETIATHLEEFRKVAGELASSKVPALVAVGNAIEADAISVLERHVRNKENALKRKQRKEMFLNSSRVSSRIARSCRTRNPVSYTHDEYDRAIAEAIQITKNGITSQKRRRGTKHEEHEDSDTDMDQKDNFGTDGDSVNTDSDNDNAFDEENDRIGDKNQAAPKSKPDTRSFAQKLGSVTHHHIVATRSPAAKNRLRQRLTRNSALDHVVVSDSDYESLGKNSLYAPDSEEQLVDC